MTDQPTTQAKNITDSIRRDLNKPTPNSAYLDVRHVSYHIGNNAILNDINFKLNPSEVLALVGPNGAGKSTLLKLLSGDLRPTRGDVLLEGIGVTGYPVGELALKRAVMSQQAQISFEFTAYEVAMMGRYPHGIGADDDAIVMKALGRTETTHLKDRLYPTLSGGEGARVTLSRVLAQDSPLMLLDEPTAALDLRHKQLVMQIARELAAEGAAVILIVHDLNLAAAYADRVGMLHEGTLFAVGKPSEVLTESNIETVFNLPVKILEHPDPPHDACPLIIPLKPSTDYLTKRAERGNRQKFDAALDKVPDVPPDAHDQL